jgi:nitroreductase
MIFSKPINDIIGARISRRRYEARPIAPEQRAALQRFLDENSQGPFGKTTRLRLLAAEENDSDALRGLGTYGFIRDPAGFIVGAIRPGDHDMEDFGYVMEQAILFATDLEIGTCWLGGTFTKSAFAERIDVRAGETVPAVVSLGYATSRQGTMERLVRLGAGSKNRKPWSELFFSGAFGVPLSRESAGEHAEPLEMVRLAPSASNRQPWRVVELRGDGSLAFYVQRTPGYGGKGALIKMADLQRIDLGIALCHFELSATEAGLVGRWVDDEPELGALPKNTEYIATWQR